MTTYAKICPQCDTAFTADHNSHIYCTHSCRNRATKLRCHNTPGHWLTVEMTCSMCSTTFYRTEKTGPNKKYCSVECSYRVTLKNQARFHELNPDAVRRYKETQRRMKGHDTLINRLRNRYTDLPTACECDTCYEHRVLDIAHKPEFKRNGAPRVMKHYARHMFWILCPTHHAIVDRGICTPAELGLD